MNTQPTAVDTVIEARWVIPVVPARSVLENHSVVIDGGRILALLPSADARTRYDARHRVVLDEHALIPGLVNLHTHAAAALLRGRADDAASAGDALAPAAMRHLSEEYAYDGARLACAEMLRGGITCFSDVYFFPRATARAALDARMRAVAGMLVAETPTAYAADADDYLSKGLALRDEYIGEPLLKFAFAPHAPHRLADQSLRQVAMYADELDLPVHMHVHESQSEVEHSIKEHGVRPLSRLAQAGLISPNLIAVHGVHLEATEIALLARHGCHVAHCPSANLRHAHGIAPVAAILAAGLNVGLGTGSAESTPRLDLFSEMRLAALLAKNLSGDSAALPAWQSLELATLGGARALGLEAEIGTLAPGKSADVTAVQLSALELAPCYDPLLTLAQGAGREHVTHVWVQGALAVDEGLVTTMDTRELRARAAYWRDKISSK